MGRLVILNLYIVAYFLFACFEHDLHVSWLERD